MELVYQVHLAAIVMVVPCVHLLSSPTCSVIRFLLAFKHMTCVDFAETTLLAISASFVDAKFLDLIFSK